MEEQEEGAGYFCEWPFMVLVCETSFGADIDSRRVLLEIWQLMDERTCEDRRKVRVELWARKAWEGGLRNPIL